MYVNTFSHWHFFTRNLFLGYYLPYRHSVPLWEMENDYYLHNFHVMNARNATAFMKNHERAFCVNCIDEEDEEELSGQDQCIGYTRFTHTTSIVESERVARVRKHCTKQNLVLSSWWKAALQANLHEKNLLRFGTLQDTDTHPGRFERVYQPEKLTQFDRVFSRAWETPVRRSHAAQHAEGADGDDSCDFARVVTIAALPSNHASLHHDVDSDVKVISIRDFVATHDFRSNNICKLKTFIQFFDGSAISSVYAGTLSQDYSSEVTNPTEKYRQYCDPMSNKFHDHSHQIVEEFKGALHDLSLSADDVAGISEASDVQLFSLFLTNFLQSPHLVH